MPTPKTVSQIKSTLLRPALTSHFEVELQFPSTLEVELGIGKGDLVLSCCEATLPGSQLATLEINNDRQGVTEKHAYRRLFDDRIDLTFYVDAKNYTPIKFFEAWIRFAMNEDPRESINKNYSYRARYPDDYIVDQGLIVRKFEKDYQQQLTYEFIRSFPIAISSMPVSFEASNLLKCTVSMSYIRYNIKEILGQSSSLINSDSNPNNFFDPINQALFNDLNLSQFPPFNLGNPF